MATFCISLQLGVVILAMKGKVCNHYDGMMIDFVYFVGVLLNSNYYANHGVVIVDVN